MMMLVTGNALMEPNQDLLQFVLHQPPPPYQCVEPSPDIGASLLATGNAQPELLKTHQLSFLKNSAIQFKLQVLRTLKLNGLIVLIRLPLLIAHQELVNASGTSVLT